MVELEEQEVRREVVMLLQEEREVAELRVVREVRFTQEVL